jgi:hypothetical protein
MLGPALDALTNERDHRHYDASPSVLLRTGATRVTTSATGVDLWVRDEYGWGFRWRTTDPAEAWEILQARDLVPLDCRSRFVCEDCGGTGGPYVGGCLDCNAIGHRPHPSTVAALASWASLGWAPADDGHPGIAGAEEWALAMVGVPAVWWRVGPVERDGVVPGRARSDLAAAGFGWSWNGRRPDGVTLVVPPLGA